MILLLVILDGGVLIAWGQTNPLVYKRIVIATDGKGRPTSSYGTCMPRDDDGTLWPFIAALAGVHALLLIYGAWISYRCRNIVSAFSESKWIAIALVGNLQIFIIGLPVLIIVANDVAANYFIRAMIIFLNDLSVIMLIFMPKILTTEFGFDVVSSEITQKFLRKDCCHNRDCLFCKPSLKNVMYS